MLPLDLTEHVHRRLNPLTGDWILVSPHRNRRPWEGQVDEIEADVRPRYDPSCYLCPGNKRAHGAQNAAYTSTYVFDNDFAALHDQEALQEVDVEGIFIAKGESGICRVICFSPRHDLTLAELPVEDVLGVVELWAEQYAELGRRDDINYVQVFENKGVQMGCSNMHPHGQIWAQQTVPDEPAKETLRQLDYFQRKGHTLLSTYLHIELEEEVRIVYRNESFAVLVPFWAFWPFETMIVSMRPVPHLLAMTERERVDLADVLHHLTVRYDNVFKVPFPYSAGLHQAPTDGEPHPEWHFHIHFYPPLLRSATIKKFKVGYEMLAGGQRDLSAESSAALLKSLPSIHYKKA